MSLNLLSGVDSDPKKVPADAFDSSRTIFGKDLNLLPSL